MGRLSHERHVEQDAPYTTTDSVAGNNQWSRKSVYTAQGFIEDAYDARQVRTHFTYDGLNRVTNIQAFLQNGSPDPATPPSFYYYDAQALRGGAPVFNRGFEPDAWPHDLRNQHSVTGTYDGYDAMGRVNTQRQVTSGTTYSLNYGYNLAGLMTSETYPTG